MPDVETEETDWWKKRLTALSIGFVLLVLLLLACIMALIIVTTHSESKRAESESKNPTWPPPSDSPLMKYAKVAVAHEHVTCSEIGRNMLIRGGNAVDAAVAAEFCSGIMNIQSSGIGGGFFMTLYNRATKTCTIIDARETAPMVAHKHMYDNLNHNDTARSYFSIAIPGQVAGLWAAYKKFGSGKVTWKQLLQPSIDLCKNGYPMSSASAKRIDVIKDLVLNEPTMQILINPETKEIYKAGEIMKRPIFGAFLEKLANAPNPVQFFYDSETTDIMVEEIRKGGGILTSEDFKNYKVKLGEERPPIITELRGGSIRVCGPPPPSSSTVSTAIVRMLDSFNVSNETLTTFESSVEFYHRLIESMKVGQAIRQQLGDIDYAPDVSSFAENVTSGWYAENFKSNIRRKTQHANYYKEILPRRAGSTSSLVVVDAEGNAVSLTSTINYNLGALRRSESTGIIWNNEMEDFAKPNDTNANSNNFIEPGKRPMSSMSPVVAYDSKSGDVIVAVGAIGGSRIVPTVAQVLVRTLYLQQSVKEAIDAPRFNYDYEVENHFPDEYIEGLKVRGHEISKADFRSVRYSATAANAIQRDKDGWLYANCDYRKSPGLPAGY